MAEERLDAAIRALAATLRSNPLNREAWLQFVFEGDAAQYNFSTSGEGMTGIGGSSLGGRLSQDGVPHIEFRCDGETFVEVVHGRLTLEEAMSSGRLKVQGGKDIWGGLAGGRSDVVRRSIVRELGSRFAWSLSND